MAMPLDCTPRERSMPKCTIACVATVPFETQAALTPERIQSSPSRWARVSKAVSGSPACGRLMARLSDPC
jgi:hypothetical protein